MSRNCVVFFVLDHLITVLNTHVFSSICYISQELLNTGIFTIGYGITTLFQLINWASVNYQGRASNIVAAVSFHIYFLNYLLVSLIRISSNCRALCFSFFYTQVFGLFNTIAYAASTYFLFLEHKAGATH